MTHLSFRKKKKDDTYIFNLDFEPTEILKLQSHLSKIGKQDFKEDRSKSIIYDNQQTYLFVSSEAKSYIFLCIINLSLHASSAKAEAQWITCFEQNIAIQKEPQNLLIEYERHTCGFTVKIRKNANDISTSWSLAKLSIFY